MNNIFLDNLQDEVKVGFILTVAERVFSIISKDDERYPEGRETLNKCWLWVESHAVTGDDLYELIDNAYFTGISEFAEEEEDLNIARLWSLLVDAVAFTSWEAYKKEEVKYLPQALEGINNDSIIIFLNSAVETGFITSKEVEKIRKGIEDYQSTKEEISTNREEFIKLL
ncbi:Imm6 family immunity protein [Bacillus haynesii]|uniref:Imm6 family immunity protein n=1 Tax=Bacillus haynesii TaxID=1925021 RepID=UPI00227E85D6|nr:Imm6 family immunity protein [Bacillus haynesii]MCY8093429.1 Imm6 family immunity protein [Bacillus haynesii]MCY8293580.1 Imm6 family immunity protein [Bacillus haynesii]MCY8407116.1 Imm6 family immunity protein [Bacillus haynesii]MCY8433670.1 Imm6 family immunity protein [Bacillus haynesii]MCY8625063.1 Imm6 family immunity protein [Bacillus haynesii]